MAQMGKWAFIVGLVISVVATFLPPAAWMFVVLAILGLVVGVMNITGEETKTFLLAAIGLIMSATSLMVLEGIGETVTEICTNFAIFISPAVLVVSLKSLFEVAKD